jgi:dihydroorotase
MPNTTPPNDTRAVTELIRRRAGEVGGVRIYPVGAVSRGLQGEWLTEVGELKDAGVVALSDDGRPVMNAALMRRALEYARNFSLPVVQHAEDLNLSADGSMNEGISATRAGLRGQPAQAEEVVVARDLLLVELTGARYHVAHVSTAGTVKLIREAKKRGLPVTCEVTPHHLALSDRACLGYDPSVKVNPPLRTDADVSAVREALAEGTIDAVATDHAPHTTLQKLVEFDRAAFGAIGLETALPVLLKLVQEKVLSLKTAIERITAGPARAFGLPGGRIAVGEPADIACVDPVRRWKVEPEKFRSKSRNTPFAGWELTGRAVATIVGGRVVFEEPR